MIVVVNGRKTAGSPVWVTVDEAADLLKCGGYDSGGGDGDSGDGSGGGGSTGGSMDGRRGGGDGRARWAETGTIVEDDGTNVEVGTGV